MHTDAPNHTFARLYKDAPERKRRTQRSWNLGEENKTDNFKMCAMLSRVLLMSIHDECMPMLDIIFPLLITVNIFLGPIFSLSFLKVGTGEFPSWLSRSGQCPKGSGVWELEAVEFSEANKIFWGSDTPCVDSCIQDSRWLKHAFTGSVVCRLSSFLFLAGTAVFVCLVGEPAADPSAVDLWGLGECFSMFFNRDASSCCYKQSDQSNVKALDISRLSNSSGMVAELLVTLPAWRMMAAVLKDYCWCLFHTVEDFCPRFSTIFLALRQDVSFSAPRLCSLVLNIDSTIWVISADKAWILDTTSARRCFLSIACKRKVFCRMWFYNIFANSSRTPLVWGQWKAGRPRSSVSTRQGMAAQTTRMKNVSSVIYIMTWDRP